MNGNFEAALLHDDQAIIIRRTNESVTGYNYVHSLLHYDHIRFRAESAQWRAHMILWPFSLHYNGSTKISPSKTQRILGFAPGKSVQVIFGLRLGSVQPETLKHLLLKN